MKRLALPLLALLVVTSCRPGTLEFRKGHRLSITAPKARSLVTEPVQVAWKVHGFAASGLDGTASDDRGEFAVFVDRAPIKVGQSLRSLGKDDPSCQQPGAPCPSAPYLADHGVYVTDQTSVSIPLLPTVPQGVGDEQHYVYVVLLDGTGKRLQESAWFETFRRHRRIA